MSQSILPAVNRVYEGTEKEIILHRKPGMVRQLIRFFYKLYPANWFNEFTDIDIKITMEELSTIKNRFGKASTGSLTLPS